MAARFPPPPSKDDLRIGNAHETLEIRSGDETNAHSTSSVVGAGPLTAFNVLRIRAAVSPPTADVDVGYEQPQGIGSGREFGLGLLLLLMLMMLLLLMLMMMLLLVLLLLLLLRDTYVRGRPLGDRRVPARVERPHQLRHREPGGPNTKAIVDGFSGHVGRGTQWSRASNY